MKFRISYLPSSILHVQLVTQWRLSLLFRLHGISLNVITVKVNFFSLNSLINIGRSKEGGTRDYLKWTGSFCLLHHVGPLLRGSFRTFLFCSKSEKRENAQNENYLLLQVHRWDLSAKCWMEKNIAYILHVRERIVNGYTQKIINFNLGTRNCWMEEKK